VSTNNVAGAGSMGSAASWVACTRSAAAACCSRRVVPTASVWVRTVSTPTPTPVSRSMPVGSAARANAASPPSATTQACSPPLRICRGARANTVSAGTQPG
jgi:hypothetical protein